MYLPHYMGLPIPEIVHNTFKFLLILLHSFKFFKILENPLKFLKNPLNSLKDEFATWHGTSNSFKFF